MNNNQSDKLQKIVDQIKEYYAVDFVSLALENQSGLKEIRWCYACGNTSLRYKKIILQVGKGFAGIVWRTGRPLIEYKLQTKLPQQIADYPIALVEHLESALVLPIIHEGEVLGVLLVAYRRVEEFSIPLIKKIERHLTLLKAELIQGGNES